MEHGSIEPKSASRCRASARVALVVVALLLVYAGSYLALRTLGVVGVHYHGCFGEWEYGVPCDSPPVKSVVLLVYRPALELEIGVRGLGSPPGT